MSNIETAYEYFLTHGFSPADAAGIVGNLIQESGVNPESQQSGGPGRGIAQWSQGGRWNPSLMTGNQQIDLLAQLNFIDQELQSNPSYGLASLLKASTPQQAASIFSADYERPGIIGNRINDATDVANMAATGNWPTATSGSVSLTSTATTASSGGGFFNQMMGFLIPGYSGASSAISDTGRIADAIGAVAGYGATKQPQKTQSHTFLGSLDELLNPTITLFNPWGAITMFLARGGLALLGVVMILGGVSIIVFGTNVGREAVGVGVKKAATAAIA